MTPPAEGPTDGPPPAKARDAPGSGPKGAPWRVKGSRDAKPHGGPLGRGMLPSGKAFWVVLLAMFAVNWLVASQFKSGHRG